MKRRLLLIFASFLALLSYMEATAQQASDAPLAVDITTDRSFKAYYDQEFDSAEELADWTIGRGWKLGNKGFGSIDADNKYSLGIGYNDGNGTTSLISPEITVEEGSKVEFYAYFAPYFLVSGRWTFGVKDATTSESATLLDAFMWAQDNEINVANWHKFTFDLSAYAGKKVKFAFDYPFGGEDLWIDGFRMVKPDPAAKEAIHIFEGESVEFSSIVDGEVDATEWSLPGADKETSKEANPTATYHKAGTYSVSVKVTRGEEKAEKTLTDYIVVAKKAPTAKIGLPDEGYESPFVGVFVPLNVPVTFRDLSSDNPTEWNWVFQNTDKETSTEQNPTVTYIKAGTVSVGLTAKNEIGQSNDILQWAIQAGGAQNVWNISIDENSKLAQVALGFYGYYAGTNWLGMEKFAEKYKAPLADATVDSVAVYFASATGVSTDDKIVMTLNAVGTKGAPGETLATATIKTGDIKYSDDDYLATWFHFDKTVEIKKGEEFFITIGPFPHQSLEESPYTTDDYSIFCVRRNAGEKSTTWHLLAEEDENYQPTGKYKWYANTDDAVSMAIAPVITYATTVSSIDNISAKTKAKAEAIFKIDGTKVSTMQRGGIYIIRYADGTTCKVIGK